MKKCYKETFAPNKFPDSIDAKRESICSKDRQKNQQMTNCIKDNMSRNEAKEFKRLSEICLNHVLKTTCIIVYY